MKTREELLEKIVELQDEVAALRSTSPTTVIKLGNEKNRPTDVDIKEWQDKVNQGLGGLDPAYTIVTHGLIDIQTVRHSKS